jgi:hypothetical protein
MTFDQSYPSYLNNTYAQEPVALIACGGATVRSMVVPGAAFSRNTTQIQLMSEVPEEDRHWATLSIGGNDVGFINIVAKCLLSLNFLGCEAQIAESARTIKSDKFYASLTDAYEQVIGEGPANDFLLVVTGYIRFFSIAEEPCNEMRMAVPKSLFIGRKLTVGLRSKLNGLVDSLNEVIQRAVNEVDAKQGGQARVVFIDSNDKFEGHRWCEPGLEASDPWEQSWFLFFGPDVAPDGTPLQRNDADTTFELYESAMAQDGTIEPFVKLENAGPFHPKSIGQNAIADGIWELVSSFTTFA